MAVNEKLEEVVLGELYNCLSSEDFTLQIIADGDDEMGKQILKNMSRTMADEEYKIRIHFNQHIGYGYDFTKDNEGRPAKEIYERAVNTTKKIMGMANVETFVKEGVRDERYGWYITKVC